MKQTIFARKVLNGEIPTAEEWALHLQQAHLEAPSMTPFAFGNYLTAEGQTSYDILAASVPQQNEQTILDLACGDGHLMPMLLPRIGKDGHIIGVDMSEGELAVARKNLTDKRLRLVKARSQEMPFANSSIDHVVCHMAFMLMVPVDPVVAEIARVLKSDGTFSAVVPSRQPATGVYADVRKVLWEYLDRRWPKMMKAPTGDARTFSETGFAELFNENTGFAAIEIDRHFETKRSSDPQIVWDIMKDTYFVGLLPPGEMQEIQTLILDVAKKAVDQNGQVTLTWPIRLVSARKL